MCESGVFPTPPFYSMSIKYFHICYSTRLRKWYSIYRNIFIMREIKFFFSVNTIANGLFLINL